MPRTTSAFRLLTGAGLLCLACACNDPKRRPKDDPPEPQATALRDAVAAPIERARAVEATVQEGEAQRRESIEAAAN